MPTVTADPCQIEVGCWVDVVYAEGANLRLSPGYANKPPGDAVLKAAPLSRWRVTHGPAVVDGLTWWGVDAGGPVPLWISENTGDPRILRLRRECPQAP